MPFNARLSQLACISFVVYLLLSHATKADEIKVAVAANFHPTLSVIAQHFEKASQHPGPVYSKYKFSMTL